MKKLLAFALTVLAIPAAHGYSREQFADTMWPYLEQLKKISARGDVAACPADYRKILAGDKIRIAIFFGYEDFEHETTDLLHSRAMVAVLRRACTPRISACGFSVAETGRNFTRLKKSVGAKTVEIEISSTSVSENNVANADPLWLRGQQEEASNRVRARFHRDLSTADIVFYHGHSRIGGGLGFNATGPIENGINWALRIPLYPMLQALEVRPSKLKLFGMFSCSSEKYYRADVERSNPGVSLIVSSEELQYEENPQALLGALDSILGQKCAKDFNAAVTATTNPAKRNVHFIRK